MDIIEAICETITTLFLVLGVLIIYLGLYGFVVVENRPEILDRILTLLFEIKDNDLE